MLCLSDPGSIPVSPTTKKWLLTSENTAYRSIRFWFRARYVPDSIAALSGDLIAPQPLAPPTHLKVGQRRLT